MWSQPAKRLRLMHCLNFSKVQLPIASRPGQQPLPSCHLLASALSLRWRRSCGDFLSETLGCILLEPRRFSAGTSSGGGNRSSSGSSSSGRQQQRRRRRQQHLVSGFFLHSWRGQAGGRLCSYSRYDEIVYRDPASGMRGQPYFDRAVFREMQIWVMAALFCHSPDGGDVV